MKKFYPLVILIILILVAGIYAGFKNWKESEPEDLGPEQEISREEIMNDLVNRIGKISPVKPVLGGKWFITRFWFIQASNKDFYIEYEDGHILRQILVEAKKRNGEIDYEVIAYFEPGETTWQLKNGEDKFFGSLLDLYEYNEELEVWEKKN